MEILPRVLNKKTYNEEGYFPINRDFIENQVGLGLKEQFNCDSILNNIGVLEFDLNNRNQIRVNPEAMNKIIINDKEEIISKVILDAQLSREVIKINKEMADKYIKEKKAVEREFAKQQKEIEKETKARDSSWYRTYIETIEEDPNLVELYLQWADSATARYSWLSKSIISRLVTNINAYTDNILEKQAVLNTAILTGYKDFAYIKSSYEKNPNRSVLNTANLTVQPKATQKQSDLTLIEFN